MDYKEKYERAIRQAKEELKCCGTLDCDAAKQIFKLFPELEEEVMDNRIKAALLYFFKRNKEKETDGVCNKDIFDWLKKQCKPNPYSGVSFEYNGHAWGMCVRDGGIDILCDTHIVWHIEKKDEPDVNYPKSQQEFGYPIAGIVLEDFNGGEGFYKLHLDYLNKQQVEDVEKLVMSWNKESNSEKQDENFPILSNSSNTGKIEQKLSQEIVPFEAEHGKYYYCIKDYFAGGKKQASKGDVVQALRGLAIMGLKDASEYFLPVNFIKCYSAWSEEDTKMIELLDAIFRINSSEIVKWLQSLEDKIPSQLK